ncbi:hypothetical protein WK90_32695 [Burkholderia cepacia]|nr:hypothetical protein WK83_32525 [Burkholderia cepacia]KVV67377.1 hypothetical protein WK85_24210 [Burkholderia cepacia]KVV70647.1 hypothetical protein WK84_13425 [Burkholderia cepacia]KVV77054.1 hypothetical protein WK87_34465 [Burkholderia cepacia]KVV85169.1 hypothetical protein WK86_11475 [Burkholderia cepacia]
MLSLAHQSLSNYAQPFNLRRLAALEELWKQFITARSITPPVVFARWDLLLPSEYSDGFAKGTLFELKSEEVFERIKATDDAESARPFAGEYLWAFFYTFRAVMGRISYLYADGYPQKQLHPWYEDESIKSMLATLFDENDLATIDRHQVGKLHTLQQIASTKFSKAIEETATGQRDSEAQLLRARSMTEAAQKAQQDTDLLYQTNANR